MADKNEITITISGDSKDLEKALQKSVTELNKLKAAGGDTASSLGGGAKQSADTIINEFKKASSLSTGSFSSIAESFLSSAVNPITIGAATIGAAIYGAFSLAQIGEENAKIAANFEFIANSAGLNASALNEQLSAAAEGYADLEDVLPIASDAILKLGKNAQNMGELFELSKSIAQRTGKDITSVFQDITNGVARQNEKILLANGIQLDSATIIKKYADANGIAKDRLTDAAKQQAILNEVLEQGRKKFGATTGEVAPLEGGIRKFKLALDDLKDAAAALANSKLGAFFADLATGTAKAIKGVAENIDRISGSQADLDTQIKRTENTINRLNELKISNPNDPTYGKQIDELTDKLNALIFKKQELADQKAPEQKAEITQEEKVIAETPEERQARLDKINEIESEQRQVELKAKLDHQMALLQIENEGGTFEEKAAAKATIQQGYADAEFEAQVVKNQKIKDLDERAAQNTLAIAKKSAQEEKNIDAQTLERKKGEADAKKQIESNLWAASLNFAQGNAEATKAIQIAQAIRNTYQGATLALANYPPPFNVIAAASTVALGMSQVAKITGAKDGALVTGGAGGSTDDNPFMLARGELVAPAKTFDEVVEGTAKERGYVKQGENNTDNLLQQILQKLQTPTIIVNSDFLTDDNSINRLAERLREAVQFRGAELS